MQKNFWLDVILFLSGLICIGTGLALDFHLMPAGDFDIRHTVREVHIYSGYVMAVGFILHIAWHWKWLKAAARQLFSKE